RRGAALALGFGERAAKERLHAERCEQLIRAGERGHLLGIAGSGDAGRAFEPQRDRLERRVVLAVGEIKSRRRSELGDSPTRRLVHQRDEPVRIRQRQRLQQDAVHHAEDRDRRPDADPERQHRGQRESGRPEQPAQSLPQLSHRAAPPHDRASKRRSKARARRRPERNRLFRSVLRRRRGTAVTCPVPESRAQVSDSRRVPCRCHEICIHRPMAADRSDRLTYPAGTPPRHFVTALFAVTGFSALCLQVVWQRVISIHGGVDLFSSATIVAAFMAGLGLGNLVGGTLADRLGARRSILAFALANFGIGLFGWASIAIFYDGYRAFAANVQSLPAAFAFHFVLLVVPTTLMGLSLPLLTRGVVRTIAEAAPVVSRLYAANTLGAAVGAAVGGWVLLGGLGFDGTVRLASSLNLVAAVVVLALLRVAPPESAPVTTAAAAQRGAAFSGDGVGPWLALYAATGAAALALEIVYFRLVDGIMRSNSYTFAHVLTLYLLLFGAGAAAAGERARRAARPDTAFLWVQFWIGAASLLGVIVLLNPPPLFGLKQSLEQYFRGEGFIYGFESVTDLRSGMAAVFAHLLAPALVMGAPVFLMGYAYPFIAALVLRRDSALGRHTGALMACNILGNVAGSLVGGFVLLDRLGTAGTLALLAALLMALGVTAALRAPRARAPRAAAALG